MPDRSDRSVFLHVGAPAAGAGFLQRALWANRNRLGAAGVSYPVSGPREHFGAVMDLREMSWGGRRDPAWEGAWDRIAARARAFDGGTVVFSQELLGGASEEQAKRAVASFEPAGVHVVFVTRDLGSQLVLDWQEQLRHAHSIPFSRFVDDLVELGADAPEPYGPMFWGLHDPLRVLGTWERVVPRENIHVITLPAAESGPGVLWKRYCEVIGIDPRACDLGGIEDVAPLPAAGAELLRRLNVRIGPALGGDYEWAVREHLEAGLGPGDTPMGLPARHHAWAVARTNQLVTALRAGGYRIVGDLAELTVPAPAADALQPDDVPDEVIAAASVEVVATLLERLADARQRVGLAHLRGRLADVRDSLDRLVETAAAPSTGLQRAARRATAAKRVR
ncbi:hypothetical protein AB0J52_27145 [Spirillospora sp. NPDC049652]